MLPIHFTVYVAEVGPNKAASANIETVFSGAGKFAEEAKTASEKLLSQMVRLHYNYKYPFLRPSNKEVVDKYNAKHHPNLAQLLEKPVASGSDQRLPPRFVPVVEMPPTQVPVPETDAVTGVTAS